MDSLTLLSFGVLQSIGVGLSAWALVKIVAVLERLAKLEGKFDGIPLEQISNNRHRVENLEKAVDRLELRLTSIEGRCNKFHQ